MKWADILGHEEQKRNLRSMIDEDRVPHAILLSGPEGVGKLRVARAMAQYLHCTNRINGDSCGKCPSCLQHQGFNQLDTYYSYPVITGDYAKPRSVDYMADWCTFLNDTEYESVDKWLVQLKCDNKQPRIYVSEAPEILKFMNLKSFASKYKVMILWLPERMNVELANRLLKIIEEPFKNTLIIMVSDKPNDILPTISSRLQNIRFKAYPTSVVATQMVSKFSLAQQDAMAIAALSEGSMVKAFSMLGSDEDDKLYLELFIQVMRLSYSRQIKAMKQWSENVAALKRERIMKFLEYSQRMIRENFIYNLHVPALNYMRVEEEKFSSRFAPFVNENNVMGIVEELNKAQIDIAGNANAKIVLFDLSVKMILLLKAGGSPERAKS